MPATTSAFISSRYADTTESSRAANIRAASFASSRYRFFTRPSSCSISLASRWPKHRLDAALQRFQLSDLVVDSLFGGGDDVGAQIELACALFQGSRRSAGWSAHPFPPS